MIVFDKTTGKILALSKSPHFTKLGQWLNQNPTFEPVKPGSPQAKQILSRNRPQPPPQPQTPTSPIKPQLTKSPSAEDLFSNPVKIHTGASLHLVVKKPSAQGQNSSGNSGSVRSNVSVKTSSSSGGVKAPHASSKSSSVPSIKPPATKPDIKKLKHQSSEEKPASSSSTKHKIENERKNVRDILRDTLAARMEEFVHDDIPKMSNDEIAVFAKEIEREMFLFFNKDTQSKYKVKYRSLKFNLSDTKNRTLLEKICAKKLTAKELVVASPSALASEELSKWREDENKHQLEIITKAELDALSQNKIVVKTHKGEEIIETKSMPADLLVPVDDVESVIAKTVLNVDDPHARYDLSRSISLNVSSGIVTSPLSSPSISSSTGRKSDPRHRSRSRSKDHHHHHHHHHKSSSKHKKSERHRSKSPKHHSSRDKERKSQEKSRERSKSKKREQHREKTSKNVEDDKASSSGKAKEVKPNIKSLNIAPEKQDVDLVGKILDQMGVTLDKPKLPKAKEDDPKVEEKKPDEVPVVEPPPMLSTEPVNEHKLEIEIYSGNMQMPDVADFNVSASIVSGSFDDILKLLPPQLDIVGRIEPPMVWDYLDKVRKFPGKEICILRFASADESAYFKFFSYLHTRQRYGVIKPPSPKIKDFYLVPVEASRPLPKALLPIVGPGFIEGDDHKPDLLLGVILKIVPEVKVSWDVGTREANEINRNFPFRAKSRQQQ